MANDYQIVFCTCPDLSSAEHIAQTLIEQQLAACVNLIPGLRSMYRWQGKIEQAEECLLLIKTHHSRYAALEQAIVSAHPYELPEIVAVSLDNALPGYLTWIAQNTDATL